ncbi:LysR family transcriptional regulator [Nocardia camponoti]|uniref:HTH lysR-type domain-containing protein n=1 Tax=Nocardia camponoti TaxID=1616106 RepID=A0A917QDB7_9NOCA|nr:LysR family transcriptional regulator [Nocardia camponoti]GGK42585.1 hypothetical protein GCM10011591_12750 [Nocardia camponoti]
MSDFENREFDVSVAEQIDLTRLRRFVAVAEELHFARAAKALHIPRQALSATTIELEAELGTHLFVPGASPTQLTDEGRALLDWAREVIRAAEQAEREQKPETEPGFRVGFVDGVTVSKWARIWADRLPDVPLEVVGIPQAEQQQALVDGRVDVCFVRLPINRDVLHAIPLWSETPVAVVRKEDELSLLDALTPADLADEIVQDTTELDTAVDALAMVAAVGGAAIVPQSIARLHHRRDLVYRPISDTDFTEIALAWPVDSDDSELREEFVGIVRGRSANSSRGVAAEPARESKPAAKQKQAPKKKPAPSAKGGAKQPGRQANSRGASGSARKSGGRRGR